MRFANVEIANETIQRTRKHFADIARDCITDAGSGVTFVNDLESYKAWQMSVLDDALTGKMDHTFTFLQRAHWLQTGECLPLLSR